jgi:hypothetical protein
MVWKSQQDSLARWSWLKSLTISVKVLIGDRQSFRKFRKKSTPTNLALERFWGSTIIGGNEASDIQRWQKHS